MRGLSQKSMRYSARRIEASWAACDSMRSTSAVIHTRAAITSAAPAENRSHHVRREVMESGTWHQASGNRGSPSAQCLMPIVCFPQHVPLAAHGLDDLAVGVAEFLTQSSDVHVNGTRLDVLRVETPDALQQFIAINGPVGVRGKIAQ